MSGNIRLRAALCLALSLANSAKARPDNPVPILRAIERGGPGDTTAMPILPWGPPPPPAPRPPAAADGAADENACLKYAKAVASWLEGTRGVRSAQREVEILDEDPVLITRATCSDEAHFARRCRDFEYDVERERERARSRLVTAEDKLAAIEEAARIAGVPMVCLDDPTD